jgi:hypothetical protein
VLEFFPLLLRTVTRPDNADQLHLSPEQTDEVRSELQKVLKSPSFQSSKRCHDFLEFIVNHTLAGDLDSLSERFLGADLFGRPIDYDTKADAIVRVRANDVRKRLGEYYSVHQSAPVVIALGTGSYIPEFQWTAQEAPAADHTHRVATLPPEPLAESVAEHAVSSPDREARQPGVPRRLVAIGSIIAGFLILALGVGCFSLWQELRNMRQRIYPWQSTPAVADFWNRFLSDQKDTDLVFADASFGVVQALTNRSYSLSDYLSRDYMNQLQDPDPRMAAALAKISNWGLASPSEFEVAQRILALDPARQKIRLYSARKYMPDLIDRDNVILMGSRFGNPWAELFENRMNFVFNPQNPNQIIDRAPAKGESPTYDYASSGAFGYCIVAYLPTPDHNGNALLIQGSSGEPTQAGGDFLLTEAAMADLRKTLGTAKVPYFELLLKTSWVKGTPINSTIVAYRTYGVSN